MAIYKETDCPFVYRVTAVKKVVDGDTLDAIFDLGFDVMYCSRVRLLGIDTPESRTSDKVEKVYGLLSKKALKKWVHWAVESDRDDVDIEIRCPEADSRGKFGRILGEVWVHCGEEDHEYYGWTNVNKWMCENAQAVGYWGQNKDDVRGEHMNNRRVLAEEDIQDYIDDER